MDEKQEIFTPEAKPVEGKELTTSSEETPVSPVVVTDKEVKTEEKPAVKEITREEFIRGTETIIWLGIKKIFGREYLNVNECDLVRTALKAVDKKLRRWMQKS